MAIFLPSVYQNIHYADVGDTKAKMQKKAFAKIEGLLLGAQQFRAPLIWQCKGVI